MKLKIGLLSLLLYATLPAGACINDRDTLAQEAAAIKANDSGLPHVVRVITGRFERNPGRYYQMRLTRVSRELKANPTRLELYDDAGAASDRLQRSAEALRWMEKKRQQLALSQLDAASKREHWYRYYANAGTFHAHLWLRSGAKRADIRDLQQGRDLIKRAIALKPNAHFGREKYQLKLMEWMLHPPKPNPKNDYTGDFLGLANTAFSSGEDALKSTSSADAVTGLSGLIVLGDAWASQDVYYALMQALRAQGDASIATLAGQRCCELLENGRGSLSPYDGAAKPAWMSFHWPDTIADARPIRHKYFELRADAMDYQNSRLNHMDIKFAQGEHPDTHPNFWKEWEEPELPSLDIPAANHLKQHIDVAGTVIISLLVLFVLGVGFGMVRRYQVQR